MNALEVIYAEAVLRLGHLGQVVIAGGAVRDHLMSRAAKDYDVFVLSRQPEKDAALDIHAATADLMTVEQLEHHKSEPFLVVTVMFNDSLVQIMWSPEPTTDALLGTFDWNVCLFAFDSDGLKARTDITDIRPGASLKRQRVTYPLSTLRRGFRFSERFGMVLERADVEWLCEAILAESSKADARQQERP